LLNCLQSQEQSLCCQFEWAVEVSIYRRVWLDTVMALKSNTLASAA
jgi:hypothetical protein